MRNLKFLLCLFVINSLVVFVSCDENYFPNFFCNSEICEVRDVKSTFKLKEIFQEFDNYYFHYNEIVNGRWVQIRQEITTYFELEFKNCQFDKFPSGNYPKFSHIDTIKAENVGITMLNRDSLSSFPSLEILNLSFNKVTTIENTVLIYLKSLETFNISHNQIEIISLNAFDDCCTNLTTVDLSHNKIHTINSHILDSIGIIGNSSLYLSFNNIEEIKQSEIYSNSLKSFRILDLSHNKIKKFKYSCQSVDELLISDNILDEIDTSICEYKSLDIRNNQMTDIKLVDVMSLDISNNSNLKNVSFNFGSLKILKAVNVPTKIFSYDLLKNSSKLTELDMSNTFLGAPKIATFSEMNLLEILKLRNTGLSNIEFGMFGHQIYLRNFDISYNNLGHIDTAMLCSMKSLETLDISGNNLTHFDDFNEFKRNFPNLTTIGIEDNNWNCSYLTKIMKVFYENSISIKPATAPIKSTSNVMGIGCTTTSYQKIKPIDQDQAQDVVSQKLNEIIDQINSEKVNSNNAKYDSDIIRTELFYLQREVIEIKSKLLRSQITETNIHKNDSKGADSTIIKHIDQLTNYTLEKQKLANDQLKLELDKLHVEMSKNYIEHDKFVQKKNLKDYQLFNNDAMKLDSIKSTNEINNNSGTTIVLLTIVVTILAVIGVVYGYKKLKNLIYRRNESHKVLARSTNTMNTTVDIPFDDRKF